MTDLVAVPNDDGSSDEPRVRVNLERGWAKHRLIRELALAEKNSLELAEDYGCTSSAIRMFKQRHRTEVEVASNNMADEYADLWIANKRNRLAELQAAAEKLAEKPDARSAEVLSKLLKDAAEELGDLPTRTQVNVNTANVTYEVVGIDPGVLS